MLFLSFNLSTEIYAVETIRVREVLQFCKITRVPRAGAQVCGVVNLRGSIITVFDLRTILGMEKSVPTQHSNIVVLEYPHAGEVQVQAFLVDSVSEVLEIESSHLNSSPAARLGGKKYVRNMARSAHGFILILDVAGLFGFEVKDEAVKLPSALSADIGDPELQSGGPSAKVDFQKTPAFSEASPDLSREEIVQTVGKAGGILAPENGGENVGSQEESVATLSGDDIETTTTGKTMTWDGGDVSMSMTVRDEHSAEEQARLLEGGGLAAMAEVLEKSGTLEGAEVLQVASDPSKALTFQDTGEVLPMSVEKEKLLPASSLSPSMAGGEMAIQDQLELAIKETLQERRGSNGLPPENGVEIVQDDSVREVVDTLVPDPGLEAEINKRKKGGKSKRSTVKNKMQKKR